MQYLFLYKYELLSLLNSSEIGLNLDSRIVSIDEEPNKQEFIEGLSNLNSFTSEEDIILIAANKKDLRENTLKLDELVKLIPCSSFALDAYRRKFQKELLFTSLERYNIDELYLEFRKVLIDKDVRRSIDAVSSIFQINDQILSEWSIQNVIKAKQDKVLFGKLDTDIRKGEYDDLLQVLFIYEDGSHIQRNNPIGFILHVFAAAIFHQGAGQQNITKLNLHKTISIKTFLEDRINNYHLSFNSIFKYVASVSSSQDSDRIERLIKWIEENITVESSIAMRVCTYFLYLRYLLRDKKLSFTDLNELFKHYGVSLQKETKIALMLCAAYFDYSKKLAMDVMAAKSEVLPFYFKDDSNTILSNKELLNEVEQFVTIKKERKVESERKEYNYWVSELEEKGFSKGMPPQKKGYDYEVKNNPFTSEQEVWHKEKEGSQPSLFDKILGSKKRKENEYLEKEDNEQFEKLFTLSIIAFLHMDIQKDSYETILKNIKTNKKFLDKNIVDQFQSELKEKFGPEIIVNKNTGNINIGSKTNKDLLKNLILETLKSMKGD